MGRDPHFSGQIQTCGEEQQSHQPGSPSSQWWSEYKTIIQIKVVAKTEPNPSFMDCFLENVIIFFNYLTIEIIPHYACILAIV